MTNWRYNVLNIKNTNELYINDHANLVPNLSQSPTRFQLVAVRRQWKNKLFFAAGRLWDVCPYFVSCISGIVIAHGYVMLPHGPCHSLQVWEILGRMVRSVSYSNVLGLLYDVKRTVLALWTGYLLHMRRMFVLNTSSTAHVNIKSGIITDSFTIVRALWRCYTASPVWHIQGRLTPCILGKERETWSIFPFNERLYNVHLPNNKVDGGRPLSKLCLNDTSLWEVQPYFYWEGHPETCFTEQQKYPRAREIPVVQDQDQQTSIGKRGWLWKASLGCGNLCL